MISDEVFTICAEFLSETIKKDAQGVLDQSLAAAGEWAPELYVELTELVKILDTGRGYTDEEIARRFKSIFGRVSSGIRKVWLIGLAEDLSMLPLKTFGSREKVRQAQKAVVELRKAAGEESFPCTTRL